MATRHVAPEEYLVSQQPAQMLVVDDQGDIYVLQSPTIVGENVVGLELGTPDTVSLPVSTVSEALVKQKSTKHTVMLVGALGAVTALGVVGVAVIGGKGPPCKTVGASEWIIGGKDTCDNTGPDGGPAQP
jgi:hypothetical protein